MGHKTPAVCWDTCVFIDGHQKTEGRIADIERIETKARSGELRILASTLAIAEVVKLPELELLPIAEERQINDYFANPFVTIVPVDRPVARRSATLVREYGLKPPDAIHLATAIRCQAVALVTYDEGSGLLGLDKQVDGFRIVTPEAYLQFGQLEIGFKSKP